MNEWNFNEISNRDDINRIHKYPAMMVPGVIDKIIKTYVKKGDLLFDPFCGTGRALTTSNLYGAKCIGLDINPLAVLISKVKMTPLDSLYAISKFKMIKNEYKQIRNVREDIDFLNIDYWFKYETKIQLNKIV